MIFAEKEILRNEKRTPGRVSNRVSLEKSLCSAALYNCIINHIPNKKKKRENIDESLYSSEICNVVGGGWKC